MPGVRENDMKMTKALAPLVILLGVAGFAVYWNFIRDSWVSPQVVRIATDDELTTLFPAYPMWFSKSEKGDPQALLLKDGDYVLGDNYFYRYAARDGAEVALTHEDGITRIGATVISLSPDKEDAAKWLAAATDAQRTGHPDGSTVGASVVRRDGSARGDRGQRVVPGTGVGPLAAAQPESLRGDTWSAEHRCGANSASGAQRGGNHPGPHQ